MTPIFYLNGTKKSYGQRTILDVEQLEIHPGEILAVVGPSGSGKSTLLRLLNFLEFTDQGTLTYDGQVVTPKLSLELRRQVTTVFQRPALLNDSVENNVAYGLRLRGLSGNKKDIHGVLERMGLGNLAGAAARTLSGGEAQRVALARAIILKPRVLLLDEPTANLDPYNINLIEEVVREINQTRQTSMVLVTHNVFQAKRLAHRVTLLLNGQVVETAATQPFFETPCDARTRAFVNGEMVY